MSKTIEEMKQVALQNGTLQIEINTHGAELVSLKASGREHLWNGDAAYWKRHSPVLFPIVGSVWNGHYRYAGQEYALSQHGFARDMDFQLISRTDDSALFELNSSDETLKKYPFAFCLRIAYEIVGDRTVAVRWEVENPSATETMLFSIGAHPAFLLRPDVYEPIDGQMPHGGYFRLAKGGTPINQILRSHFGNGGCLTGETETVGLSEDGLLEIKADSFARDAIVAEREQVDEVTLLSADKKPLIRLRFAAPLVGLWAPRTSEYAPFVCIEPWYGRADRVGFDGDFADKDWQNVLKPKAKFQSVYYIDVMD